MALARLLLQLRPHRRCRYLVTLHALRDDALANLDIVARILGEFLPFAGAERVAILAYGVLPDRMHVVVQGPDDAVRRLLRMGMRRSDRRYERETGCVLWSHLGEPQALTSACDTFLAARYVCRATVRAWLAMRGRPYSCVGSALWTLEELGVREGVWRVPLDG